MGAIHDRRDIGIVRVVRQQKKKEEKGAPRQLVCVFVIVRFFFLCLIVTVFGLCI